jgi:AcrR family transcriptional regulator
VIGAAASLVEEHGLTGLTMSDVADRAGIGRATLYKYFSSPEDVLTAWHQDSVERHVMALREAGAEQDPWRRLRLMLETYAVSTRAHAGGDAALALHQSPHVKHAQHAVRRLIAEAIAACAAVDLVRSDVPAEELSTYCVCALDSVRRVSTRAARGRVIAITLDALRPHGS